MHCEAWSALKGQGLVLLVLVLDLGLNSKV